MLDIKCVHQKPRIVKIVEDDEKKSHMSSGKKKIKKILDDYKFLLAKEGNCLINFGYALGTSIDKSDSN